MAPSEGSRNAARFFKEVYDDVQPSRGPGIGEEVPLLVRGPTSPVGGWAFDGAADAIEMRFHLPVFFEDVLNRSLRERHGSASVVSGDSHREMLASVASIGNPRFETGPMRARMHDCACGMLREVVRAGTCTVLTRRVWGAMNDCAECDGVAAVQSWAGRGEARVTHPAGAVSRASEAALGAVLREAGGGVRRGL